MNEIYVVIGFDGEFASIDDDCIFSNKEIAEGKMALLMDEYPEQTFCVESIDIGAFVKKDRNKMAEAILEHACAMHTMAGAFKDISRDIHEFVACTCSLNATGKVPTHPTIIINKEK